MRRGTDQLASRFFSLAFCRHGLGRYSLSPMSRSHTRAVQHSRLVVLECGALRNLYACVCHFLSTASEPKDLGDRKCYCLAATFHVSIKGLCFWPNSFLSSVGTTRHSILLACQEERVFLIFSKSNVFQNQLQGLLSITHNTMQRAGHDPSVFIYSQTPGSLLWGMGSA